MSKLNTVVGKFWRQSPETPRHMTVFGTRELTKFVCLVCKEEGYLSEAYMKSKRDRKSENDVRPYHATCYLKTNGKYVKQVVEPVSTLEQFVS